MATRDPEPKQQDALTAAHLYYIQGHTMAAIATELKTSRSSVSRLLSYARDTGLVEIRIQSPLVEPRRIEAAIRSRFSLSAHVAPVPADVSEADRLERVAATAARVVAASVDSHQTVGIAWGSTMTAVIVTSPPSRPAM